MVFKTAGAIVHKLKDNERHRFVGADQKGKKRQEQSNLKLYLQSPFCEFTISIVAIDGHKKILEI